MLQSLLIDAGNLFLVAPRRDFAREFLRQQRVELPSNGLLTRHSEKLLHAGVPGVHDALEVHGEDTDMQGLNDSFAEVFEAHDLEGLLLERTVKLGIVEGYGHVACNRLTQFDGLT